MFKCFTSVPEHFYNHTKHFYNNKLLKTPGSRTTFSGSTSVSRGTRRDFDTLQNTRQAQEFVRVAKTLAGVVDLKRVRTMLFAWQAQGLRALWCRSLRPRTLNPWKACKFHAAEMLLCSDHFAWQLQEFVCLGSTFWWQAQYFWRSLAKTLFAFELQNSIFEGSVAEKLRFLASKLVFGRNSLVEAFCLWASKLDFWKKSCRKASQLVSYSVSQSVGN